MRSLREDLAIDHELADSVLEHPVPARRHADRPDRDSAQVLRGRAPAGLRVRAVGVRPGRARRPAGAAIPTTTVADPALSHLLQAKHRELESPARDAALPRLRRLPRAQRAALRHGQPRPARRGRGPPHACRHPAIRTRSSSRRRCVRPAGRGRARPLPGGRSPTSPSASKCATTAAASWWSTATCSSRRPPRFRRGAATALLQHEIGTHVVTHVNGSRQPLRLLGAGLAGYDETQEGLAVFAEYLVGGLTAAAAAPTRRPGRCRPPDDRRGHVPRGPPQPRRQRRRTSGGVHDHDARLPIGRADEGRRLPPRVARRARPPRRGRPARRALAREDVARRRPVHRGSAQPARPRRTAAGSALPRRARRRSSGSPASPRPPPPST